MDEYQRGWSDCRAEQKAIQSEAVRGAVVALLRVLRGDAQALALDNERDRAELVRLFCKELERCAE